MENKYHNEDRYYTAKKRVNEIKGFYGNLVSYILVNLILLAINFATSPECLWFFWPLLGWGVGVVIHGMIIFQWLPFFGKDWEEKKIKEFIDIEKRTKERFK
ncbi:2TM domain-containing protein [Flavobacterium psychrophilum]